MPWEVRRNVGYCKGLKPWAVVVQATGDIVACHATKAKALAQMRALYANEPQPRRR
jgi:hypothetical protein